MYRLGLKFTRCAVLVATTIGCSDPTTAADIPIRPSADVLAFIEREGLPRVQSVEVRLDVPPQLTQVFRVVFGDSTPVLCMCERGTVYVFRTAIGLQSGAHVDWLRADTAIRSRFDFGTSDTYLFTQDFFDRFGEAEAILFQQDYKGLMASDLDTPESGLWLLVHGLSTWISPWLADRLMDNPNVATNRDMLVYISQLPVFQGDAYKPIRERAAALLAAAQE